MPTTLDKGRAHGASSYSRRRSAARTEALAQFRRSRRVGEAPTATLDVPEDGRAGPDLAPSLSRGEGSCRKLHRGEEPVRPRSTKDANAAASLRRAAEPLRPPYGATALLMAEGVQHLAHMPPERRRRIFDPLGELLVGATDVLPKVEAGKICAPASSSTSPPLFKTSASAPPQPRRSVPPLAQLFQGTTECLATREHGLEQVTVLFDALERLAHPEAARRHALR